MTRLAPLVPIAALLLAAGLTTAEAGHRKNRGGPENAVPESRLALDEEWRRAREAGGYDSPVRVLGQVLRGEPVRPGQVQRPLLPGPPNDGGGLFIVRGRIGGGRN